MILLPSNKKPQLVGGINHRRYQPWFRMYDTPAWTDSGMVYSGYLTSQTYSEYYLWEETNPLITDVFPPQLVSAVILGDCNADSVSGGLYFEGEKVFDIGELFWGYGEALYVTDDEKDRVIVSENGAAMKLELPLAPGQDKLQLFDQKINIRRFAPVMADSFSFTLNRASPVTLHKLYIGGYREICPCSNYTVGTLVKGQGKLSDWGLPYGYKMPGARTLECAWDIHDDLDRRVIEEYAENVQNVQAHFVEPCKQKEYIPPIFGVLNYDGFDGDKQKQGWYWKGQSLKWVESK